MASSIEIVTLTREQLAELLTEAAETGARRALASVAVRPAADQPRQLFKLSDAAKLLAVSTKTLSRRVAAGAVVPATRDPLRFDLETLRRQLAG